MSCTESAELEMARAVVMYKSTEQEKCSFKKYDYLSNFDFEKCFKVPAFMAQFLGCVFPIRLTCSTSGFSPLFFLLSCFMSVENK